MIPSGLQALMEASAVLQQEASQTAPGPQGQQPTIASQVMQQAQQAVQPPQIPQMQAIGRQAGIAGQLMAQRQQQQQQTAQNPQAIAQMAAQMLQQKGVAALPTNMQFREGGIIGYAGPQGSVVANPVADRELAEIEDVEERLGDAKRRRIREERERLEAMRAPYARAFGMTPTELEDLEYGLRMAENEYERAGPSEAAAARAAVQATFNRERARRSGQVRGGERPTDPASLAAIPREAGRLAGDVARPFVTAGRNLAGDVADAGRMIAESVRESPVGQAAGAAFSRGMDQEGIQSLIPGSFPRTPEPSNIRYAGPDEQFARAPRAPSDTSTTTPTPAPARADVKEPSSAGIAAALPSVSPEALSVTKPDYQKILRDTPESPESIARRQEKDKLRRERLGIAQAQEDLSARGIEALSRAKKDREQLLESARSRDTYDRLSALFTSMRTLGNEVGNTQRAIQAREEAVVSANLLHEESVLKLKQAQQARQLGLKDQEIQLIESGEADEKKAQELLRADAKIQTEIDKSIYTADTREMTAARDRAHATALKLVDLRQQAKKAEDDRETRRLIGLQTRLSAAQDSLTRAKAQVDQQVRNSAEGKAIEPIEKLANMGAKLNPEQEKKMADFKAFKERLEAKTLQRFYSQLNTISKELGLEVPTIPTQQYDSSGNRIQ